MLEPSNDTRTMTLEKTRLGLRHAAGAALLGELGVEQATDLISEHFVSTLRWYLLGNTIHREVVDSQEVPVGWWSAFKIALYPKWLLRKFPPTLRTIKTEVKYVHVCPHLNIATQDREVHLRFLAPPEALWNEPR